MNLNLNGFLAAYLGPGCENKKKDSVVTQMRTNPHYWHQVRTFLLMLSSSIILAASYE